MVEQNNNISNLNPRKFKDSQYKTIELDLNTIKKIINICLNKCDDFEQEQDAIFTFTTRDNKEITIIKELERTYAGDYDVCNWEYYTRFLIKVNGKLYRYDYTSYYSFYKPVPKLSTTLIEVEEKIVSHTIYVDVVDSIL